MPPDGGNEIIVRHRRWSTDPESTGVQLARLDTRTGLSKNLNQGIPDHVSRWVLDWRGEPYAVETFRGGKSQFHKRDEQGRWQPWFEDDGYSRRHALPEWVGPDGQVLGTQSHGGYTALFQLDPKTAEHGKEPCLPPRLTQKLGSQVPRGKGWNLSPQRIACAVST